MRIFQTIQSKLSIHEILKSNPVMPTTEFDPFNL